ncbi:MAG: DEAD/DEAH box helicase [Pseudomonadota bacterium]
MNQFEALGLSPVILKSIRSLGYHEPTPIQRQAIPPALTGRDLMGLAQTGTGKTAAFGLPLVHHLLAEKYRPASKTVRALILAPTRELANQITTNLRLCVRNTHLRTCSVIGGASIVTQARNLSRGTDILVATPGRLLDLVERRAVILNKAKFLVLDEADQMLDLGFIHALRKIAKLLGTPRQTLLFSATMPKQIEELSRTYLSDPVRIEITPPGRAVDKIVQSVHFVGQSGKTDLLKQCLGASRDDLSLVFARTKHGAERLMKQLVVGGFAAGSIHGNKTQGQRDRAIKAFRTGEIRVLVATDVAARGIDIPGVSHVYNYDLPQVPENYIHRIGRTARAGASGQAVAFCGPDDTRMLRDIERLMGISIQVVGGEPPEDHRPDSSRANKTRRRKKGSQSWKSRSSSPSNGTNGGRAKQNETDHTDVASDRPGSSQPKPANRNRRGKWRPSKRRRAAA